MCLNANHLLEQYDLAGEAVLGDLTDEALDSNPPG
jgi:hypothetical protein